MTQTASRPPSPPLCPPSEATEPRRDPELGPELGLDRDIVRSGGTQTKRAQDPEARQEPDLDPELERQIDENLRRLYQNRLEQDLPDDLLDLVAQLRDGGDGKK